jgi:tRNA(Ile)-lysidine synthase TilS/MesJ
MTHIFSIHDTLYEVRYNPTDVLMNFIQQQHQADILPSCQQLDLAWQLCQYPADDRALRNLVIPTLAKLEKQGWPTLQHANDQSLSHDQFMAYLQAAEQEFHWVQELTRMSHLPADLRQRALALLAELN